MADFILYEELVRMFHTCLMHVSWRFYSLYFMQEIHSYFYFNGVLREQCSKV